MNKTCAIICEYNPMHTGHIHQIEENQINSIDENDELAVRSYMAQIIEDLLDEDFRNYTEVLFDLLKKIQKKAKFSYESNVNLGIKAYLQKNYI